MRIIDKNRDYYDYLQYYDDNLVYDRRGSYILTDEEICNIIWGNFHEDFSDKYLLLQVGYSYWLILAKCESTAVSSCGSSKCVEYSLELIEHWKDYHHFDKLHFGDIKKDYSIEYLFSKKYNYKSKLIDEVKLGNYEYKHDFTIGAMSNYELIFNKTKIPSVVNANDLYNAFDEYLSHLKDDVDVDKMTNDEKIESHGFDKKTSFRGK